MRLSHLLSFLFGIALIIFFILINVFPKNASLLPFLLLLTILDGYLWFSIQEWVFRLKKIIRYSVLGLYWFPLMLLISSMITGWSVPFLQWNIFLRTYIPGFIVVNYFCKAFPIAFLIINDMLRIFRFGFSVLLHKENRNFSSFNSYKWFLTSGWVTGGILFVMMILGMVWWNYDFQIKKVNVFIPELPAAFDDLKIVHISDLHLGSWYAQDKLTEAIQMVNELQPDMIFITGDIANYSTADVLPFERILSNLRAPKGIFTILGNHDYGDYVTWSSSVKKEKNHLELISFYQRLGWILLLNEHFLIKEGSDSIVILGVQNWGKTKRFQKLGDVGKAGEGIEKMDVQLLLTHDPSNWEFIVSQRYRNIDISFAGHTHGFQLGIECCGFQWSPAQYLYPQWAGLYAKSVPGSHPQYLYVNRGLGSLGYPGRIGILPEITLITLTRD